MPIVGKDLLSISNQTTNSLGVFDMQNLFIRAQIAARQRVAQRMSRIYALRTKPSKLPIQRQTIQHCESGLVRRSSQL